MEQTNQVELGGYLNALATARGVTQAELGKVLGVDRATVSRVYKGAVVKLDHYDALATYFGMTLEEAREGASKYTASLTPSANAKAKAARAALSGPPRTLTIASRKGGTCKTTSSVSIAGCLARRGYDVVLVDLDGQANATGWLLDPGAPAPTGSAFEVVHDGADPEELLRPTVVEGLRILPGHDRLDTLDRKMVGEWGAEKRLARAMRKVRADFVVYDCPGDFDLRTVSALLGSRWVLVPTEVSSLAISGLAQFIPKLLEFSDPDFNPDLEVLGVLMCRYQKGTILSRDVSSTLDAHLGELVMTRKVRESVRYKECPSHQELITDYAPRMGKDYVLVTDEILERMEVSDG
jgi:chromosome partitioning protein